MPYQEILSRAWQIFKRQRALWLFGFLSACTGGVYGRVSFPSFRFQLPGNFLPQGGGSQNYPVTPDEFERFVNSISEDTVVAVAVAVLVLILAWSIFALLLRAIAEPSLVRGILADVNGGQPLHVGEIYRLGKPFFGRTLLFYLLVGGTWLISLLLMTIPLILIAIATMGVGVLCLLPLFLLAIPLIWLIEIYLLLTYLALVLEEAPLLDAFKRGWQVMRTNFWHAVLMGLLLTVIRWGVSLMIGIVMVVALAVTIGPLVLIGISTNGEPLWLLISAGVFFVVVIGLGASFLMGMLQTYLESAWVLAYRHFTAPAEAAPKPPAAAFPPEAAPPADLPPAPETT